MNFLFNKGLEKEQFENLYELIATHDQFRSKVTLINALGLYLTRLKTGNSIKDLHSLMPIVTLFQLKSVILQIRSILSDLFVPIYLGVRSTSRVEIIEKHTTITAKTLLSKLEFDLKFVIKFVIL